MKRQLAKRWVWLAAMLAVVVAMAGEGDARKIILKTFFSQSEARKGAEEFEAWLQRRPDLAALLKAQGVQIHARPSGRYHILVLEPVARKDVGRLLPLVRTRYRDAYANAYHPPAAATAATTAVTAASAPAVTSSAPSVKKPPSPPAKTDAVQAAAPPAPSAEANLSEKPAKSLEPEGRQAPVAGAQRGEKTSVPTPSEAVRKGALYREPSGEAASFAKPKTLKSPSPSTGAAAPVSKSEQVVAAEPAAPTPAAPSPSAASSGGVAWSLAVIFVLLLLLGWVVWIWQRDRRIFREEIALYRRQYEENLLLFENINRIFRKPLDTIWRSGQYMMENGLDSSLYNYVVYIEESVAQLKRALDDVRDFATMITPGAPVREREFDLETALEEVIGRIRNQSGTSALEEIELYIEPAVAPRWRGDERRFKQMFANFLLFLAKGRAKGRVAVSVSEGDAIREESTLQELCVLQISVHFIVTKEGVRERSNQAELYYRMTAKLAEMQGGRIVTLSQSGVDKAWRLELPLRRRIEQDRRKYRLPSKSLIDKRILLVIREGVGLCTSLKKKLRYFRYDPDCFHRVEEVRGDGYDILFIDEESFAHLAASQERLRRWRQKVAKKIVVVSLCEGEREGERATASVDGRLGCGFTQQQLFVLLLALFREKEAG